jgi:predicted dehydrogenase
MSGKTTKTIRWGVIGAGGIALRRTIPECLEMLSDVKIVSVMCKTAQSAADVAAKFDVPHHTADEDELLAQDLDAVYVASPQDAHCGQVIKAANAGKHILCEKPIAISLREVDQMEEAVNAAGIKFMLGFACATTFTTSRLVD